MKYSIKTTSSIALIAFLLNAILPFFAVYDASTSREYTKKISSLFGENILICSGDGFKWAKSEDLQNGKEEHNPVSRYKCALCYLAAHGLKDFFAPAAIALSYFTAGSAFYASGIRELPSFNPRLFFHSRAPPLAS